MQLKINSVYAIETEYETYIGTYRGVFNNKYVPPNKNILWNVKFRIKQKTNRKSEPILVNFVSINQYDIIYDLDKIKQNAKKAKESFEKRCLDKILKRLVNEHFEW
jgi:3-deoxy-D-arabino-heptulosonate 7-phosphate (DAHP) synthase class II